MTISKRLSQLPAAPAAADVLIKRSGVLGWITSLLVVGLLSVINPAQAAEPTGGTVSTYTSGGGYL